jgi:hypothetical protein
VRKSSFLKIILGAVLRFAGPQVLAEQLRTAAKEIWGIIFRSSLILLSTEFPISVLRFSFSVIS